ncbi:hypothetical protein CLV24_102246 [Pontibacter ummariensis]|uniref:Uncharacterized protein n=1 Tax=Pontibacter ummariensis TaxID=1610492 RepID=A0A239BV61_9BACT|nr:hypothetical protein [Pontibacter ummariensis]PRY15624.1 hypothetical protein CLV24_102246 [Pontibacter ummariensis]SNS11308.1 hypothetical protein SAMN06296052_102166 [Pontibacter ummariensis]
MPLNEKIEKVLNKVYQPKERYDTTLLKKDVTYITNELGEPVTLFIGKRNEDGSIAGERYVRTIVREPNSNVIRKSHWDLKGKVSRG